MIPHTFSAGALIAIVLRTATQSSVLAAAADGAVLVLRYGKTGRAEARRAVQALASVNARLLGSVLNFAPKSKRRGGYDGYGYGYGYGKAAASTANPAPIVRPVLPAPSQASSDTNPTPRITPIDLDGTRVRADRERI